MYGILFFLTLFAPLFATLPTEQETIVNKGRIEKLLAEKKVVQPQCISVPEGEFIYAFHPEVYGWLEEKLTAERIGEIAEKLKAHLELPLTKEGFAEASTRRKEGEYDPTAYDAIWVRDCCWQYYALKLQNREKARALVLSLLRFYSTPDQIARFEKVIKDPSIADPDKNPHAMMDVPLIRFSGKTLTHYIMGGKPQEWNHLQFDSHGLFMLMLSDALTSGILSQEDLTAENQKVLSLFPLFFQAIRYWANGDAGPWEENLMLNASSAGIVAEGIKRLGAVLKWGAKLTDELFKKGVERVERDLAFGGEAPNLDPKYINRDADAALLFLCIPDNALYSASLPRIREILDNTRALAGPYGIARYKNDAYQAANFWIDFGVASPLIGPKTPNYLFTTRLNKGFAPAKTPFDAQWFFDSIVAMAYYKLTQLEKEEAGKAYYLRKGDIHLKRSLGQLTGPTNFSAEGEKLDPWLLAESINTVIDTSGKPFPMHSPICPLGWATAALQMALDGAQKAHLAMEKVNAAAAGR